LEKATKNSQRTVLELKSDILIPDETLQTTTKTGLGSDQPLLIPEDQDKSTD
jgi:hypothetical protein